MNDPTLDESGFFAPPAIAVALLNECRTSCDFRPIIFEWYRHVAMLVLNYITLRDIGSSRPISDRNYSTVIGLLGRCSKLMRGISKLSADGGGRGEATSILQRSLMESTVKIRWLCQQVDESRFDLFVADGLKSELRFRKHIQDAIGERGEALIIEERMLSSIQRTLDASELTESQIESAKRLPNNEALLTALGEDPIRYTITQRIGSHAVHGTWTILFLEYLRLDESGKLVLRDTIDTPFNTYLSTALSVLEACEAFVNFMTVDADTVKALMLPIEHARQEIYGIGDEAAGSDYKAAT